MEAYVIFFSYFWHSYFLRYGQLVDYKNYEYACNELMQLTVVVGAASVT